MHRWYPLRLHVSISCLFCQSIFGVFCYFSFLLIFVCLLAFTGHSVAHSHSRRKICYISLFLTLFSLSLALSYSFISNVVLSKMHFPLASVIRSIDIHPYNINSLVYSAIRTIKAVVYYADL